MAWKLGGLATAIVTAVIVSACNANTERADAQIAALEERVSVLEKQKGETTDLWSRVAILELKDKFAEDGAAFNPSTANGYVVVDTSVGALLVMVDGIEPHGNGSRLKLLVGNPLSARLRGVDIKVRYGAARTEDGEYHAWEQSLKTAELGLSNELTPGSWTRVQMNLGGSPPNDLGFAQVHIEPKEVFMEGPAR